MGFTFLISLKNRGTNLRDSKLPLNETLLASNDFLGLGKEEFFFASYG
jgi:hypothetical protein|tara:strand:- start:472 stop:615 length:144 start_codon:yes stop_codon:yes gene_type:complete